MRDPAAIKLGLFAIANEAIFVAAVWHVLILIAFAVIAGGWRPSRMKALLLCALPLASVAAVAGLYGNPFNAIVFAGLALVLLVAGLALAPARVSVGPPWAVGAGVALALLGFVYPHFVDDLPAPAYLLVAPVGLLPCPTLMLISGMVLAAGGFESRTLALVLGLAGVFYGVVGVLVLGVDLDLVLIAGALALSSLVVARARRAPAPLTS